MIVEDSIRQGHIVEIDGSDERGNYTIALRPDAVNVEEVQKVRDRASERKRRLLWGSLESEPRR